MRADFIWQQYEKIPVYTDYFTASRITQRGNRRQDIFFNVSFCLKNNLNPFAVDHIQQNEYRAYRTL